MKNDTVFLKSMLKAKKDDGFRLKSEITDEMGIIHRKFQQYYKGIEVDNAEYLVHGKNDIIDVANGDYQDIDIFIITPSINEQQALKKALEYVGAKEYKWEDPNMEKFIKLQMNDPSATYYPKGELVIAKDYLSGSNSFKLAWKFTISSQQPYNEQMIFVDAITGVIIRDVPLLLDDNKTGGAQTLYSGLQGITFDAYPLGGYRLYESRSTTYGKSVIISTLNCSNGSNIGNATEFTTLIASWTPGSWPSFYQNQAALDAHWAAEKVLDYWSNVHGRNSIDNKGLNVTGYVHYYSAWNNAQWDQTSRTMRYGDGDGTTSNPFTALDIVAHEMGHGITQFTANLTAGNQESGALNEGFSDIWAACVKHWAAPDKPLWLMGGEILRDASYYNCIRNIQNPKSIYTAEYPGQHHDTYHDTKGYWDLGNEPHRNSTVLSHWFYLLCEGGSGTNDISNAYNVTGIGIDKAQVIAYKAETNYLNSSANFSAARNATISAAIDKYGINSQEVISTVNAWYAVGVGSNYRDIVCSVTASANIIIKQAITNIETKNPQTERKYFLSIHSPSLYFTPSQNDNDYLWTVSGQYENFSFYGYEYVTFSFSGDYKISLHYTGDSYCGPIDITETFLVVELGTSLSLSLPTPPPQKFPSRFSITPAAHPAQQA